MATILEFPDNLTDVQRKLQRARICQHRLPIRLQPQNRPGIEIIYPPGYKT
jgi:hypothetical protein